MYIPLWEVKIWNVLIWNNLQAKNVFYESVDRTLNDIFCSLKNEILLGLLLRDTSSQPRYLFDESVLASVLCFGSWTFTSDDWRHSLYCFTVNMKYDFTRLFYKHMPHRKNLVKDAIVLNLFKSYFQFCASAERRWTNWQSVPTERNKLDLGGCEEPWNIKMDDNFLLLHYYSIITMTMMHAELLFF